MPARNEAVISIHELQVLINSYDTFALTYPCTRDFPLLDAKPKPGGYQLDVRNPDFASLEADMNGFDEVPRFNDFRETFLASGCIQYGNMDDFKKFYKNLKGQSGFKPTYFIPDTNILYHRFITNSSNVFKGEKIGIAPTVFDEVNRNLNHRVTKEFIDFIKLKSKPHAEYYSELYNKRSIHTRKRAYFAMRELGALDTFDLPRNKDSYPEGTSNDYKIVFETKLFEKETATIGCILSADRLIEDYLKASKMNYFLLQYQPALPSRIHSNAESFRQLIFLLSGLFGFIKFNNTIIFAEYNHKPDLEIIKIRFLNEENYKDFNERLEISRKLMNFKKSIENTDFDF